MTLEQGSKSAKNDYPVHVCNGLSEFNIPCSVLQTMDLPGRLVFKIISHRSFPPQAVMFMLWIIPLAVLYGSQQTME